MRRVSPNQPANVLTIHLTGQHYLEDRERAEEIMEYLAFRKIEWVYAKLKGYAGAEEFYFSE